MTTTGEIWMTVDTQRRDALCALEGETKFEELQRFLTTVHTLAAEGRLSRYAFMGEKAGRAV